MFVTKFVIKIKTYILRSVSFFSRKSYRLWDNVEKYGTARQATDDNTILWNYGTAWQATRDNIILWNYGTAW